MRLSACLIVKDEQQVIARCLACVKKFADEIIVVDTGSTDNTVAIARTFTDKIYSFNWQQNFAEARNFSLEQATGDYIIWLDADDVVTQENCVKIRRLVTGEDFDLAFLPYAAAFDDYGPVCVYYRERIFKRACNFRFSGAVHEAVTPRGKVVYSGARIDHRKVSPSDPTRNLKIYQNQITRGICLDERQKFYYGRELMFNKMYLEAAAVLQNFLRGDGWKENKIEALLNLHDCYLALGEEDRALNCILQSFSYDRPRPRACCALGSYFMQRGNTEGAIYWYTRALAPSAELDSGGFFSPDYSRYIPCLQLCVLYHGLGNLKRAYAFNELAGRAKPRDKSYLHNRRYLLNKLSNEVN